MRYDDLRSDALVNLSLRRGSFLPFSFPRILSPLDLTPGDVRVVVFGLGH